MTLSRRDALALGAAAVTLSALPAGTAFADPEATQAAIDAFTGGADAPEGAVEITAPEIAENGNTVPIEVKAEGASSIIVLADGNPNPGVATFHFGALAVPAAATRIRMAGTQNIIAVAKLSDGSFVKAVRAVKVTIGGCGG